MFKPALIILLYFNVIATVQLATVAPAPHPPLPIPCVISFNMVELTKQSFTCPMSWEPVTSDPANPILGFKVKVWKVDRCGALRFCPDLSKDVPGADSDYARITGMELNVRYSFTLQAYSALGEGPTSQFYKVFVGPEEYNILKSFDYK